MRERRKGEGDREKTAEMEQQDERDCKRGWKRETDREKDADI